MSERGIYHEAKKKPAHGGGDAAGAERTRICNAACLHQERAAWARKYGNVSADWQGTMPAALAQARLGALGADENTLARYDAEITILKKAEEMLWEMVRG